MKRTFGAVAMLALLLPGVWLMNGQTVSIPIPAELPLEMAGTIEVGLPVLIFAGIPTLFTLVMFLEATGHVRERKPPS
ncbi:hypothetical protein SAMN04487967_2486 [Natronorubrum sediminis]|uniref:Uncharacterized protein n=1 Tax=Natronorubrum sediminis TaxID=640943 RepID=A0A1H6G2S6_9EURY|nr:hypothetical protein [Natronorubrum sediminis]SEH16195.1 hypothetical protein SAMN04487967_2486 [Natronorubrum sediminis]